MRGGDDLLFLLHPRVRYQRIVLFARPPLVSNARLAGVFAPPRRSPFSGVPTTREEAFSFPSLSAGDAGACSACSLAALAAAFAMCLFPGVLNGVAYASRTVSSAAAASRTLSIAACACARASLADLFAASAGDDAAPTARASSSAAPSAGAGRG